MKRMALALLCTLLLVPISRITGVVEGKAKKSPESKPTDQLQGKWKAVLRKTEGKLVTAPQMLPLTVTIHGDQAIFKEGKYPPITLRIEVVPTASPRKLDVIATEGKMKGRKLQGIYRIQENTLMICVGFKNRPKTFTAARGEQKELFFFKRVKQLPEEKR